jgi:hypothetical protein
MAKFFLTIYSWIMSILHYCFYIYFKIINRNNSAAQDLERFAYYKDQIVLKNKIKDKEG